MEETVTSYILCLVNDAKLNWFHIPILRLSWVHTEVQKSSLDLHSLQNMPYKLSVTLSVFILFKAIYFIVLLPFREPNMQLFRSAAHFQWRVFERKPLSSYTVFGNLLSNLWPMRMKRVPE